MTNEVISPLRRRMIEDMAIRKLSPKTQIGYIRHVKNFAAFVGRSPDTASADDLRRFQLHQRQNGVQASSMNSAVSGLRFFFGVTLDRPDMERHLTFVSEPRKLAVLQCYCGLSCKTVPIGLNRLNNLAGKCKTMNNKIPSMERLARSRAMSFILFTPLWLRSDPSTNVAGSG